MNTVTAQSYLAWPLIGRTLIAVLFVGFAIQKIVTFTAYVAYMGKLGFPAPELMVWLAIVIEMAGGLLLIVGWRTRWTAWLLIVFVIIGTAMAHRFWEVDAAQYGAQLSNFLKNLAIIGGLLLLATYGPGSASVDRT